MDAPVTACPPPILKPSGFGAAAVVVLPAVCLFNVDVALALDSRSVVLFSCLPSRFAQENASVARHESARLPRPPLPLLLAHGTHKPNSFSYLPNTFFSPPPTTVHLFLEGKLSLFIIFFFYKISRAFTVFCLLLFFAAYFIFLLFPKKNVYGYNRGRNTAGLSSKKVKKKKKLEGFLL